MTGTAGTSRRHSTALVGACRRPANVRAAGKRGSRGKRLALAALVAVALVGAACAPDSETGIASQAGAQSGSGAGSAGDGGSGTAGTGDGGAARAGDGTDSDGASAGTGSGAGGGQEGAGDSSGTSGENGAGTGDGSASGSSGSDGGGSDAATSDGDGGGTAANGDGGDSGGSAGDGSGGDGQNAGSDGGGNAGNGSGGDGGSDGADGGGGSPVDAAAAADPGSGAGDRTDGTDSDGQSSTGNGGTSNAGSGTDGDSGSGAGDSGSQSSTGGGDSGGGSTGGNGGGDTPPAPAPAPAPAPTPPAPPPGQPMFPDPVGLVTTLLAELRFPLAMGFRSQDTGSLYVALRHGVVLRLRSAQGGVDGATTLIPDANPALDMSSRVGVEGEMGLLGIAFSPAGDRLYTSSVSPEQVSELWEWPVAADGSLDKAAGRLVLSLPQPLWNHNGGDITFGPDGYLYLAFGDGGGAGDPLRTGQDPTTWLGSVLRIDPRPGPGGAAYTIPADNPYADGTGGAPEVWLWGTRNPWRISFDSATGDLWIGDVGQDLREEITRLVATGGRQAGRDANLGWSDFEGSVPFWSNNEPAGHVRPTIEYQHGDDDRCSVTGGYVYRGRRIPGLAGVYLYSDYCDGTVWGYTDSAGAHPVQLASGTALGAVLSFGQGPDGEIYVLTPGALLRLESIPPTA